MRALTAVAASLAKWQPNNRSGDGGGERLRRSRSVGRSDGRSSSLARPARSSSPARLPGRRPAAAPAAWSPSVAAPNGSEQEIKERRRWNLGEINEISQCKRNESTSSNRGLAKAHFAGDVWKHHQRGDEAKLDSARKNILSATLNVIGEQVKSPWICAVVAVHLPTPSPPAARALGTLEKRGGGRPAPVAPPACRPAKTRRTRTARRRAPRKNPLRATRETDGPNDRDRLGAARSGVGLHLN